jgi:competence ComEA-like helix-hairpin-helix protein
MWKNFFFFSGSQRAGIVLLICLIVFFSVLNFYLPRFTGEADFYADSASLIEFENFRLSLESLDSIRNIERSKLYRKRDVSYSSQEKFKAQSYRTFPFNPNTLDSAGFVALGLKPYVASNILKYRRKGGKFKDKTAFSHVYGIAEEKFAELEPFIEIPQQVTVESEVKCEQNSHNNELEFIVELNTADTAELMKIKGIGRGYARSIIRFRQQTGGFVSVNQLSEIYGMTPENLERIKPYCSVNPDLVHKINVNVASVDKLRAHPYLNFYQARQIYELRRKKGKLSGLSDLERLSELNDSILKKISPYLKFD